MDNLPDLQTGISRPDLFELFKQQLKKDFESSGLDTSFVEGLIPDYEFLIKHIAVEVQKADKRNALVGLLYRVDISEKQIHKLSSEKKEISRDLILAELLLKRELQKIVIRSFYKNKD
jgi:hypothetical protein